MANDSCQSDLTGEMELIKVTLAHCPYEDRVRMDGLGPTAGTIRIWLTHRLLTLLVKHLGQFGRQAETLTKSPPAYQPDAVKNDNREEGSVVLEPGSPEVLVSAVDVRASGDSHVELTYKDSQGRKAARLCLTLHSLEKWTASLKRCFEAARWPLDPFLESKIKQKVEMPAERITIH